MSADLSTLLAEAQAEAPKLTTRPAFETFKAQIVGPQGALTQHMKSMGKLSAEERPEMGKKINEAKRVLEALFSETLARIEAVEARGLLGDPIDPTLPGVNGPQGARHPLAQVRERMISIFRRIGFYVAEGLELESDWACCDALNIPPEHPARAEHDTYYLRPEVSFKQVVRRQGDKVLMRTQTSTIQIRTMLAQQPPVRIVATGRCFRRDAADATHSANFHQMEGLCVDKHITVSDLKSALDYFLRELFGQGIETRFRPSFFPFTVPSFEMDLRSNNLGKLSGRWVEVFGCGMVDREVFKNVGYDPTIWRGYAFGMGVERFAMLLQGVDDIRHYYQNDLRFLGQF